MEFRVERESLETALHEAIATLAATRSTRVDEQRFHWLYHANPDGPAVLWSVREQRTGAMAGFTVCLPRRILIEGKPAVAWNGADFSILPRFRTLGVALKLRRAAKIEIDAGVATLLFAHPNEKMQLIHEQVGHVRVGRMVRYAIPLRLAGKLPRSVPAWAASLADATAGRLVTFSALEAMHRPRHELRRAPELHFDSQHDRLFVDASHQREIIGVRDAAYLDWRYRQYPSQRFQLIQAQQSNRLQGYVIFTEEPEALRIQDIFGNSEEVLLDLVVEVTRLARKQRARSVSMALLEQSRLIPLLERIGFRQRPDYSNMYCYAASGQLQLLASAPNHWLIHVGDRDV